MGRIYKRFTNWFLVIFVVLLLFLGTRQPSSSKEVPTIEHDEATQEPSLRADVYEPIVNSDEIQDLLDKYVAYLDKRFIETHSVGAAVGIVHKGKVILLKPFGLRDIEKNDPVDINTVFRLASVSKGFAGVLAAKLDYKGILDIDDKIIDYLPSFKLKDSVNTNTLTIEHTLSHTTGLVPHAYDDLIELDRPVSKIIDELYEVNLSGPPGRYYSYQNVAFSLIDTILKVKTGKSYSKTIHNQLFEPLGMHSASTCFQALQLNYNTAAPHYRHGRRFRRMKDNDRYYSVAPAAGVNASINDMTKWLLALTGHRPDVVDPCTLEMISKKQIRTPLKWVYLRNWKGAYKKHYGLGWRIVDYQGREVMYHAGYVCGYKAEIAFSLKDDIGIVFLMNSPNKFSSEAIPQFLSQYFEYVDSQQPKLYANK